MTTKKKATAKAPSKKKAPAKSAAKPKDKAKNEVVKKRAMYSFLREMGQDEMLDKGRKLSELLQERVQIEHEKKESMSGYKKRLDEKTASINSLSHDLSTGRTQAKEMCDIELHFDKGEKFFKFDGKVVGRERLSAEDHQTELPLDDRPGIDEPHRKTANALSENGAEHDDDEREMGIPHIYEPEEEDDREF